MTQEEKAEVIETARLISARQHTTVYVYTNGINITTKTHRDSALVDKGYWVHKIFCCGH